LANIANGNLAPGGIGNTGATGASVITGYLGTSTNVVTQPNGLGTFSVTDVGAGDFNADGFLDIVAVSSDDVDGDGLNDTGDIVVFAGLGDGTFGVPLSINQTFGIDLNGDGVVDGLNDLTFVFGLPNSVAVGDIDLDNFADFVVGEDFFGIGAGTIETYSGLFIATLGGAATQFDDFGFAFDTFPVNSVAFGRLNDDSFLDIVYSQPLSIAVFTIGSTLGGYDIGGGSTTNFSFISSPVGTANGGTIVPAPRAVAVQQSNVLDLAAGNTQIDSDLDIFVATSSGIDIIENNTPVGSPFVQASLVANLVAGGSAPVGVIAQDVTSDNIIDVLALNRGSGTVSTYVASSVLGYAAPRQSLTGANPVSFTLFNFNGAGGLDLLVSNSGTGGVIALGSVSVLNNGGGGVFTTARTFGPNTPQGDPLFNPMGVTAGKFDLASATDDIVVANAVFANGALGLSSPGGVYFLDASQGYFPVFLKIFSAISLATDFDGSGGLNDLALIEQNTGSVIVLLNVNNATPPQIGGIIVIDIFTLFNLLPTSATSFVDSTGNNSIAITDVVTPTNNTGSGQIIIGLNDGTGNFFDPLIFRQFVATPGATNIVNGDFDNDGLDDLAYIDFNSNFAAVVKNDGTDFFLQPNFRETGGFVPVSAAIADVNDDDNLDLVVLNQSPGSSLGNQSIVSVLNGTGDGRLVPTGALLQVPSFGLSIVGGLADLDLRGVRRTVDFNNDGYPDFALVSTRGAISSIGLPTPTVTLILNRPDAPGNFTVQLPIPLIDDTPANGGTGPAVRQLDMEDLFGGPGIVSGRGGQTAGGIGVGGANYVLGVADFNADGSPDLVVSGGRNLGGLSFRSTIFLVGNETAGTMRISRPLRSNDYTTNGLGISDPITNGGDSFVGSVPGNFFGGGNLVPDSAYISINGNLWVDQNVTSVLNHAPVLTIQRSDLNAPFPGGGRKVVITAGQSFSVPVTGFDADAALGFPDRLTFSLVAPPTGEQPPAFVTVTTNANNTGTVNINSGDVNRGPGQAIFRIAVQATDAGTSGPGGRLPLIGREYFTLLVNPNSPPSIGAIPNQNIEAGKTATINLIINDPEGNTVTNTVSCDKGNFVTANGNTLTIAPQAGDVGSSTCTVKATDQFGLSSSTTFAITVTPQNLPPTLAAIQDQTVQAGQTISVPVSANDPNGNLGLRLALTSNPAFVSISDNGNGTGTIRISPALTDTQGGRVTVQVTDQGGLTATTSFNVTVQKAVNVSNAVFDSRAKNLFVSGIGFGSSGAKLMVNGQDISSRIIGQSDNSITAKGNKKKLNLKSGPNQVVVVAGGVTSNIYTFTLLVD
jgi:hypothetical protein